MSNRSPLGYILELILDRNTGNEAFEAVLGDVIGVLHIAVMLAALALILVHKPIRKRLRTEDRLMFAGCLLIIGHIAMYIVRGFVLPRLIADNDFYLIMQYICIGINEGLFLLIILLWLITVDYSLYHSRDHIRRHLASALIPIVIVSVLSVLNGIIPQYVYDTYGLTWGSLSHDLLNLLKFLVELIYAIAAVVMVKKFEHERREPQFLRVDVFMIPFLIGALFRSFGIAMTGIGVILSYVTLIRWDRFIDMDTQLYNRDFLSCIGSYWDKRGYADSLAMMITSSGNDASLANIMKKLKFQDSFPIRTEEDHYILLTAEVTGSATGLAKKMIRRDAGRSDPPFEPEIRIERRREGQSMSDFVSKLIQPD